jgi:sulfur-oxidizing protein SoxY
MSGIADRLVSVSAAAALAALVVCGAPLAKADEDVWPTLKETNFGNRDIKAEDGFVTLDAPVTAEDAAVVPLTVRVPPSVKDKLKSLTLIIDKNPNPVVAKVHFGPAAGTGGERSFSTRVRVDNFSHVRAILETAGGCAAMQAKDPDADTVGLGKTIVKTFPPALSSTPLFEGLVMIKHPNANGMQLDINTGDPIPARFVKEVVVKRDGELVFDMDTTFSISTNPNFRFSFGRGTGNELEVAITDTDGTLFTGKSQPSWS